jgi:WD40 repeat protein
MTQSAPTLKEFAALVRANQQRHWRRGERVLVEAYLLRHPTLAAQGECVVDLIYAEMVLREQDGDTGLLDEYLRRFPQHADTLRRQFALHADFCDPLTEKKEAPAVPSVPVGGGPPLETTAHSPQAADAAAPVMPERGLPALQGYRVVGELGRGGMGVVYQAHQEGLNRLVALKMILSGACAGPEELARFRREAEAVARLQHPNIVQIHEVGAHDGLPFFSLEFCSGGSLGDKLNGTPLLVSEAAALAEKLARAMHAAHEKGIVHRDLKPANVLLAADGTPKITDFGLARKLDEAGQTATGAVLGTPSYMAPEQAGGRSREIGPATDVYALGAVLYECLTGRPPFKAATSAETLLQVLGDEPVPPRQLQPKVPRDLETICLKCLQKESGRRYATALDLAEDLRRFRAGEPITARPVGTPERLLKWVRRRPALASVTVVGAAAALVLMAVILWSNAHLQTARQLAENRGQELEQALAEKKQNLVDLHIAHGAQLAEEGDALGALTWWAEGFRLDEDAPAERQVLHRRRLADTLQQVPRIVRVWTHPQAVNAAGFSPDGLLIVTAGEDGTARVWELATGAAKGPPMKHQGPVRHAAFSPDGRLVVTISEDRTARIWNVENGQPATPPLRHENRILHACFNADSDRVVTACADHCAYIWDAVSGREVARLKHEDVVLRVACDPASRRVVTASHDGKTQVWDEETGTPLLMLRHAEITLGITPLLVEQAVGRVAFSPDGRSLVTAGADGTARWWETATGTPKGMPERPIDSLTDVAFNPDGRRVATACKDGNAFLWDVQSGKQLAACSGHSQAITQVCFSPDGRRVLTVSLDRTACLWDAATGGRLLSPLKHNGTIGQAAFSPDGRYVLTSCTDGTARLWDIQVREKAVISYRHNRAVLHAEFSPNGKRVVSTGGDYAATVWDAETGELLARLEHQGLVYHAAFSPDGRLLVTASDDGSARVWDARTGKALTPRLPHSKPVFHAAFSPDGRRVVTASMDAPARIWDAATGKPITSALRPDTAPRKEEGPILANSRTNPTGALLTLFGTATMTVESPPDQTGLKLEQFLNPDRWIPHAAFDRAGRKLVTTTASGTAQLWDAERGEPLGAAMSHQGIVYRAAFSPDGSRLITAASDHARVWDATTGQPVTGPLQHGGAVFDAGFSPDGRRVLTAGKDGTARLWDAASGEPLGQPLRHHGLIRCACFSPDGALVLTASDDQTARLWDSATGDPVGLPLKQKSAVLHVAFSRDGQQMVTACKDGTARVWDLAPPDERPAEDLLQLAHLLGGRRCDVKRGLMELQGDAVAQACQALQTRYPADFSIAAEPAGLVRKDGEAPAEQTTRQDDRSPLLAWAGEQAWDRLGLASWVKETRQKLNPRVVLEKAFIPPQVSFSVRLETDHADRIYRKGEKASVRVIPERDGYLYLLECTPDGQIRCLFPNRSQTTGRVSAGKPVAVTTAIPPDKPLGSVVLQAVVTPEPLKGLEAASFTDEGHILLGSGISAAARLRALADVLQGRPNDWSEGHTTLTLLREGFAVGVFIGINNYQDTNIHQLRACVKDAQEMASALQKNRGLARTWVLTDKKATMGEIEKTLCQEVLAATVPGDEIILYWSGHGGWMASAEPGREFDCFLVPSDGEYKEDDRERLRSTMVGSDRLKKWLEMLPGRKLSVILDTVHSGGIDIAEQDKISVLASCTAKQVSFERTTGDYSVMTYFLLDFIRSSRKGFTLSEAFDYVRQRVPAYVQEEFAGTIQTPVLRTGAANENPLRIRKK